MSVGR